MEYSVQKRTHSIRRSHHLHNAFAIHLDGYALEQALAPGDFHLNYHASDHALAPRVFRLNRRDLAPRIFHLNHHTIRQALAPGSFVSGLKSGWRVLQDADFPALADQVVLLRWKQ